MTRPQPFFTASGLPEERRGRLLLVSYHFPPGQAAGALRWQKLSRYAAERGWALDVLTLDPHSLLALDSDRLAELPQGTRVFGVPRPALLVERLERLAWQCYRALRPRLGRRASADLESSSIDRQNPLHGDIGAQRIRRAYAAWLEYTRDLRWARWAASVGIKLTERFDYAAVISCGPPHMAHEAARLVADRTGRPFVMDLRDPWSLVERLAGDTASPIWYWLARRYERPAVARAALIVMNTEPACQAMQRTYPDAAERIMAVMNGYDEDSPLARPADNGRFTVVFAGSVYLDRNPALLLRAAAVTIRELLLTPTDIRLEFIGHVGSLQRNDPSSILATASELGIADFVGVHSFRPRQEVRHILARATMLVSLNQDSRMAIPSKIFEYMEFPAWLLALAERGSATELLLGSTDADVVVPGDTESLVAVLRRRYLQHLDQGPPVPLARHPRFSRRHQAALLFDALERILVPTDAMPRALSVPGGRG